MKDIIFLKLYTIQSFPFLSVCYREKRSAGHIAP